MEGVFRLLLVILYFMLIGIAFARIARFVGSLLNFTELFKKIFRLFKGCH